MSEDGSKPKSAQGSDAERDLLSRESLIRPLTSKERAALDAPIKTSRLQKVVVAPLEEDAQADCLNEDDEDAADDDWSEADL